MYDENGLVHQSEQRKISKNLNKHFIDQFVVLLLRLFQRNHLYTFQHICPMQYIILVPHLVLKAIDSTNRGIFMVSAVEEHCVSAIRRVCKHCEQDDHDLQPVIAAIYKVAVEYVLITCIRQPCGYNPIHA